jgi:hypothetical protein
MVRWCESVAEVTSIAVVMSQARIRGSTATGGAWRLARYRRAGSSLPNSGPRSISSRARTSSSRSQHSCPSAQTARTTCWSILPWNREPGQRPNSLTLEALPPDPLAGQDQLGTMADRAGGRHRFLLAALQEHLRAGLGHRTGQGRGPVAVLGRLLDVLGHRQHQSWSSPYLPTAG